MRAFNAYAQIYRIRRSCGQSNDKVIGTAEIRVEGAAPTADFSTAVGVRVLLGANGFGVKIMVIRIDHPHAQKITRLGVKETIQIDQTIDFRSIGAGAR